MNRQMVGAVAKPPGPPVRTAASGEGCLYSGQNGLCWLPLSPCSDEADRMSNGLCVVFYRQDLGILPVPTIYSVSQITCLAQSCQSQRLFPCTFLGFVLHVSSFFCIFSFFFLLHFSFVPGCREAMLSCSVLSWRPWNPFSLPQGAGHFPP